jgi:SNF2 family DNA or RNA helicase
MAKGKKTIRQDFAFFQALLKFYADNRGTIRKRYKQLSKQMLDFNDPELRTDAFLRKPQFEALEIYVFLKEFGDNAHVHQLFQQWAKNEGIFSEFQTTGADRKGQGTLLPFMELEGEEQYQAIFAKLSERARSYPNYIFALTMGLGKTILMATCIFYEFLLANKFSKDTRFCKNALVFAPDKTVLQSLKEIQTFDLANVVPPEYANFLRSNLKFHFLDDTASTIGAQDGSSFNVIISNTQKIILKRRSAAPTATDMASFMKCWAKLRRKPTPIWQSTPGSSASPVCRSSASMLMRPTIRWAPRSKRIWVRLGSGLIDHNQ